LQTGVDLFGDAHPMGILDASRHSAAPAHLSLSPGSDLLRVRDLTVYYCPRSEPEFAVLKRVEFTVASGEIVGLLGESGCGKTTTALALMQTLPPSARVAAGSIEFAGHNLPELDEHQLCQIRGSQISIIPQNSDALNPLMRVGPQVMEVLRAHKRTDKVQMRDEIRSLFALLGLKDCDRIYSAFPHQLSGGERRRIAIAQSLVCKPRLVIADEPSAWLDSGTTAEIIAVFQQLRDIYNTAFLLISHDPETLNVADRLLTMYAGEIIENGPLAEVIAEPKHPYTAALLKCRLYSSESQAPSPRRFCCIPGQAPDPAEVARGCAYSPRCESRMPICDSRNPELIEISGARSVRCWKYEARA
jgi:peptide/nickel transport system ATP-binding protein